MSVKDPKAPQQQAAHELSLGEHLRQAIPPGYLPAKKLLQNAGFKAHLTGGGVGAGLRRDQKSGGRVVFFHSSLLRDFAFDGGGGPGGALHMKLQKGQNRELDGVEDDLGQKSHPRQLQGGAKASFSRADRTQDPVVPKLTPPVSVPVLANVSLQRTPEASHIALPTRPTCSSF